MSSILDGKVLAAKLKEDLAEEVSSLKAKYQKTPRIISIAFGHSSASQSYIASQQKTVFVLADLIDDHSVGK